MLLVLELEGVYVVYSCGTDRQASAAAWIKRKNMRKVRQLGLVPLFLQFLSSYFLIFFMRCYAKIVKYKIEIKQN